MVLETAKLLAKVYGHKLDNPLTYATGVALSGRLRLATLEENADTVAADIARLVQSFSANPALLPDAAPCLAVGCFGDELYAIRGDEQHRDLVIDLATRVSNDADMRVEDFFFCGTLLGRAYKLSGDDKFARKLVKCLISIDTQQDNDLYWHCHASPIFWGRGNAFAAMGFSEALTYLTDHPQRDTLIEMHTRHLNALRRYRHESGMWHQVINDRETYLEHSATTMIGYSIGRGILGGWLSAKEWLPFLEEVWVGVEARISQTGALEQVCVGTGPLKSLTDYVERPFNNGLDDRGGAMALWLATTLLELPQNSASDASY